jgi:hypothetical protein
MSIITGGVLAILSIPLYCTGISQLNKAARSTRAQGLAYVPQLSLEAQPSGIGLGIRF